MALIECTGVWIKICFMYDELQLFPVEDSCAQKTDHMHRRYSGTKHGTWQGPNQVWFPMVVS